MSTDPVDLLRRAAEKLRERAEAATRGEWRTAGLYKRVPKCICLSCYEDEPWAWEVDVIDGPDSDDCFEPMHVGKADAEYIALMHPPVALALADLLDAVANADKWLGVPGNVRDQAYRAARAVLREPDPTGGA